MSSIHQVTALITAARAMGERAKGAGTMRSYYVERLGADGDDLRERIVELERELRRRELAGKAAHETIVALERQVATLREALEEVRSSGYSTCDECGRLVDVARAALEAADAQEKGE